MTMLFLVDLPAPVHGMSAINRSFLECLTARNIPIKVINTVPSYAARHFSTWRWTPLKVLHSFWCILRLLGFTIVHSRSVVYRSVNGGIGQLFDIFYFGLCRIFGIKLYIHHHSFSYLNRYSKLFALINKIAGAQAVHIVLGEDMRKQLVALYGISSERTRVQSNLAFFDVISGSTQAGEHKKLVIGHLANLTFDKGLDTFVEVCYGLNQSKVEFEAIIAGPVSDSAVKRVIDKALADLPNVKYIGPLYGIEKLDFYQKLDAFIFPSKYVNEAEPLVLYEAATNGSLLIGTRRGCMQQVISSLGGHSFKEDTALANAIATVLQQSQMENAFSATQRMSRSNQFKAIQSSAKQSLTDLINEFESHYVPKSK